MGRFDGEPLCTHSRHHYRKSEDHHYRKLDTNWKPTRGAICYELQTSADPVTPASWTYKDVSASSATSLNSFTSGAKMWVRVRAVGAENNKGPWSDPAAKTVP